MPVRATEDVNFRPACPRKMVAQALTAVVRRHASLQQLQGAATYQLIYDFVGYGYVLAWGISFYPQLILNWRRKSTAGMSIGFQWYNLLGFSLYLIYTSFVPDATVQDQMFAAHALVITACTLIQVPLYGGGASALGEFPKVHGMIVGALLMALDACLVMNVVKIMSMMNLLYACGYLKTGISLVKYTPQLFLNWQRKSTVGFAMGMVLLDITGGSLSFLQQFLTCSYDPASATVRDAWTWEPFSNNIPKLMLSVISVVYDLAFIYQHYVMYPDSNLPASAELPAGACTKDDTTSNAADPRLGSKKSRLIDGSGGSGDSGGTDNPQED